ncbi:MAG: ion transporter [Lachnospiraceae bacterium]|nr:ion transporter [Lachnospiraceae bacterium]
MDLDRVKKRVFDIIQIGNFSDIPSRIFDIFLVFVILLNITVLFLETFDSLSAYSGLFDIIEKFTLVVFCIEYLLRIWTAEYLYPRRTKKDARIRFLYSFDGIVDLLTILPFFFLSGFIAFRMLRVVRIFHLFRINANYDSFNVITAVLWDKKNQIFSSLFIIFILMMASSLCMYSAEHDAQPELFRNAFSGIWWSVSALLTVGYGDIYPVTVTGRILAVIISFLGVGLVAVPTGIISAGFVENYTRAAGTARNGEIPLVQIQVGIDSAWNGKKVSEIHDRYGINIVLASRSGRVFKPGDDFRVEIGDRLAYYIDAQDTNS